MNPFTALILAAAAAILLLTGIVFFGRRKPGYRHLRHTISELGEVGAPDQQLVAWGLFFPVGLLVLGAVWAGAPYMPLPWRQAWWWFGCVAVGYLGAALFPCDEGAPSDGNFRNELHNLCGGLEYAGGGMAMLHVAEGMTLAGAPPAVAALSQWAGVTVLGSLFLLIVPGFGAVRGLVQRVAEGTLFCWLLWMTLGALTVG